MINTNGIITQTGESYPTTKDSKRTPLSVTMLKRVFIGSLLLSSALSLNVQSRAHLTKSSNINSDTALYVSGGDIVPALKVRKMVT
jgi:hypothetical protein